MTAASTPNRAATGQTPEQFEPVARRRKLLQLVGWVVGAVALTGFGGAPASWSIVLGAPTGLVGWLSWRFWMAQSPKLGRLTALVALSLLWAGTFAGGGALLDDCLGSGEACSSGEVRSLALSGLLLPVGAALVAIPAAVVLRAAKAVLARRDWLDRRVVTVRQHRDEALGQLAGTHLLFDGRRDRTLLTGAVGAVAGAAANIGGLGVVGGAIGGALVAGALPAAIRRLWRDSR